jgi:hypothetical protein
VETGSELRRWRIFRDDASRAVQWIRALKTQDETESWTKQELARSCDDACAICSSNKTRMVSSV